MSAKGSELRKLSEESLTRPPEEVFDVLEKLGEGSYGSVYKAMHKETVKLLPLNKYRLTRTYRRLSKKLV